MTRASTAQTKALESRLFYKASFAIYGGVSGLYDYGPPGTAVKSAITQLWRQHFVLHESMLELECPAVTPEPVLRASGHVERFQDFMVRDELDNCLRADHLLEARLEAIVEDAQSSAEQKQARLLLPHPTSLGRRAPAGAAAARSAVSSHASSRTCRPQRPTSLSWARWTRPGSGRS